MERNKKSLDTNKIANPTIIIGIEMGNSRLFHLFGSLSARGLLLYDWQNKRPNFSPMEEYTNGD